MMVVLINFLSCSFGNSIDKKTINATKNVGEDYFRDLLKRVTQGESVEGSASKIINNESELRSVLCQLHTRNNETDAVLDQRELRIILEMRKLNLKLIAIERKVEDLRIFFGDIIREEIRTIKEEMLKTLRQGNVGNMQ
jgi:hypothetical protein